jgi:hypothetical protein
MHGKTARINGGVPGDVLQPFYRDSGGKVHAHETSDRHLTVIQPTSARMAKLRETVEIDRMLKPGFESRLICSFLALGIAVAGCTAEKAPETGRVSLEYVDMSDDEDFEGQYIFKLANGTSRPINLRGWSHWFAEFEPSLDTIPHDCFHAAGGVASGISISHLKPGARPPKVAAVSPRKKLRLAIPAPEHSLNRSPDVFGAHSNCHAA